MPHGGRRHGLAPRGRAERIVVSLAPEDRAALVELAKRWRCTQSEAVRRLIRVRSVMAVRSIASTCWRE